MIYFDTDVIVHSIIIQDRKKHDDSIQLIKQAITRDNFFISFLVLHETAFVLSRLRFADEFVSNNVRHLSTFASFQYSNEMFTRATELANTLGFKNINDCVHIAIAEQFADELVTYNKKDFGKIEPLTDLNISLIE